MNSTDPDDAISRSAAEWLGRRDGTLSREEQAAFQAWLQADPRHARAYHRLEHYSRVLDRLAELRSYPASEDVVAVPPDRAAGSPGERPSRRRRGMWVGLAAAAVLAVGATLGWRQRPAAPFQETAITAVGESRRIPLPDGSMIVLNTDSALRIDYTPTQRAVALDRGEAHFKVASDARRPFVVGVGGVGVRAVGTAFSIRRDSSTVDVLVTQGRVRVLDVRAGESLLSPGAEQAGEPVLAAGQRVRVVGNDGSAAAVLRVQDPPQPVPAAELARRLAWQERRLEFGPTPLGDVVAEFNRYSNRRLVLADPEIAGLSVGGSFAAGDVETLVRLLEATFGIVAERRAHETVLRRAAVPVPAAPR